MKEANERGSEGSIEQIWGAAHHTHRRGKSTRRAQGGAGGNGPAARAHAKRSGGAARRRPAPAVLGFYISASLCIPLFIPWPAAGAAAGRQGELRHVASGGRCGAGPRAAPLMRPRSAAPGRPPASLAAPAGAPGEPAARPAQPRCPGAAPRRAQRRPPSAPWHGADAPPAGNTAAWRGQRGQ